MTRWLKLWPVAAALVAALSWQGVKWGQRRIGVLTERIHAREAVIAALARQAAHTDTVFHRDTVRLSHTYVRTDSILQTDTLWRTDTVRALVQAERNACTAVVTSCVTRVAQRDSAIALLNQQIKDLTKHPGFLTRSLGKLTWAGAGFVAGTLLK